MLTLQALTCFEGNYDKTVGLFGAVRRRIIKLNCDRVGFYESCETTNNIAELRPWPCFNGWLYLYLFSFCCKPSKLLYMYIYIYIYIIYIYIQTVMDERITLCKYTTHSFMFYTFVRYTFLFYLKKQGQNCYWI